MPAKNKDQLLLVTKSEFSKLDKLLDEISSKTAIKKREQNTSVKDIIGHRAHWIELFLGWYKDGQAGKEVFFPAKGYKWNQLKEYNKELRAKQAKLGWTDVKKQLRSNHRKLVNLIKSHSNAELYGGPMKGAKSHWTSGRFAEVAGPSHYRSASKYIRQCMRENS